MIGGVILGGLFLATCAWMAASEGTPGWGRVAIKYAIAIPAVFGVMLLVIWAWPALTTR